MKPHPDMGKHGGKTPEERVLEIESNWNELHSGKYSYKDTVYLNASTGVKIYCKTCKDYFVQKASVHSRGFGCKRCSTAHASDRYKLDVKEVHRRIKEGNGKVIVPFKWVQRHYTKNDKRNIPYICKICLKVKVSRFTHLEEGHSCPECANAINGLSKRRTYKEVREIIKSRTKGEYTLVTSKKKFESVYRNKNSYISVKHKPCGNYFYIRYDTIANGSGYTYCPFCRKQSLTKIEKSVKKTLDRLGVEYFERDRNLIKPYEIDFLIQDRKLAIEVNGVYWHSSKLVGRKYHVDKLKRIEGRGYKVFFIWEDWWHNKRRIVVSMLRSKLGLVKNRIYARDCELVPLDKTPVEFYNKNHIQGSVNASINIALTYRGKTVSVMSFSKNRFGEIELVRFANRLNTSVVGAFTRLLKNAVKMYSLGEIVSFSDNDYSSGDVYLKNGWEKIKDLQEDYFYVHNLKRYHKSRFRKNNIIRDFPGIKNGTEFEMVEKIPSLFRCYNSGKKKFVYKG